MSMDTPIKVVLLIAAFSGAFTLLMVVCAGFMLTLSFLLERP